MLKNLRLNIILIGFAVTLSGCSLLEYIWLVPRASGEVSFNPILSNREILDTFARVSLPELKSRRLGNSFSLPNTLVSGGGMQWSTPKSAALLKYRNVGHKKHAQSTGLKPNITHLEITMPRILKTLKWTAISTAILLLLLVVFSEPILRFVFHDLPFMGKSFDQAAWSSALSCRKNQDCLDKEMACLRGPMYRDLEKNHLVTGTPRATVVGLIGEPTMVIQKSCLDYELGYCSGLQIDADFLRVCFDSNGKVNHVFHWQS